MLESGIILSKINRVKMNILNDRLRNWTAGALITASSIMGCSSSETVKPPNQSKVLKYPAEQELLKLHKEYKEGRISGDQFIRESGLILLNNIKNLSPEVIDTTTKILTEIGNDGKKNNESFLKIYKEIQSIKASGEFFNDDLLKKLEEAHQVNQKLGIENTELTNQLKLSMKLYNSEKAEKDLNTLVETLGSNLLEAKPLDKPFINRAKEIIAYAIKCEIISTEEQAYDILKLINMINPIANFKESTDSILANMDKKEKIDDKTIIKIAKSSTLLSKIFSTQDETTKIIIRLLYLYNFNQDGTIKSSEDDLKLIRNSFANVQKILEAQSKTYISDSINSFDISEFGAKQNQGTKKKTLKSKGSIYKTQNTITKIKEFFDKYKLDKVQILKLADGKIVPTNKFINALRFFSKLNKNQLAKLDGAEKEVVAKVKKILDEHKKAILRQHIIGHELSSSEIDSLVSTLEKLK